MLLKDRVKPFSNVVLITIVISTIVYFIISVVFENQIPLPILLKFRQVALIYFAVGYFMLIPVSLLARVPKALKVIVSVVATPVICLLGFLAMNLPERINNSGQLGNQNYYVSAAGVKLEYFTKYTMYRCNSYGMDCIVVDEEYGMLFNTDLILDESLKKAHFFVNGYLYFSDGVISRSYELSYAERLGQDIYWLAYYSENPFEFIFYRCNDETRMDCELLPFHYSQEVVKDIKNTELVADGENNTVSIYIDGELIYVYGSDPKCYVENCSLIRK